MLKLVTGPSVEPISVEDAKLHLRVDHTDEDAVVARNIKTARELVEDESLHKLITQTWSLYMDAFPGSTVIELPNPPLQSVTGVYYTPEDGVETTFSSTKYAVDAVSVPGRIVLKNGETWPGDTLEVVNGVRIEFVCGFGDDPEDVEASAAQAMLLLVGHLFENREQVTVEQGSNVIVLPEGVHMLLMNLRMKAIRF